MPHATLTPAKYWSEVELLSTEIEDAIIIHHTYEEINRLAVHDEAILKSLNKDPLFWQTQMHCLQTSLFLTLSRIFDNKANAHTIHKLINATLGNLQLFSAAAPLPGKRTAVQSLIGLTRIWRRRGYRRAPKTFGI